MSSRLLQRFNADIDTAAGTLEADCLRAQRAAYQMRVGAFERADAEITALRSRYAHQPQMALNAWVNPAEGLGSHATDLDHRMARDKIRRAHAMSQAIGLRPLQAQSAAWLAHMAYLNMEAGELAQFPHARPPERRFDRALR